ncbi:MAG: gamma-glutamyltransferase [bacterium]
MTPSKKRFVWLLFFFFCAAEAGASDPAFPLPHDVAATAHPLASEAALEIFRKGGNAIDAAVAAAFALNVVEPQNSGMGGGGFMMIYLARAKEVVVLDYREVAPAMADEEVFRKQSSQKGEAAAAVPGFLKGMAYALQHYGRLPLKDAMAPAVRLAEKGFPVSPILAKRMKENEGCLGKYESSKKIFFRDGRILKEGEEWSQQDLAKSFKAVASKGPSVFYEGEIARAIDRLMKEKNGLLRLQDLKNYTLKRREPLHLSYHGYDLALMPPPSAGGILISEMLQIIQDDPLQKWGWASPREAHLLSEAMRVAFYDRARFLGDEDFVKVPKEELVSPAHAKEWRSKMRLDRKISERELENSSPVESRESHTTHASFVDREGNVVAMTNSLNLLFGSCVIVPGTGILLNDHMDDFSIGREANAFGLAPGELNRMKPGKRPLSSMSPTLVFKAGRPVLALGSPGGPTILTNVFQVLINRIDHGFSLEQAVEKPKLNHQYLPDVLQYETGYPETARKALEKMGYRLEERKSWGNVQAVEIDPVSGKVSGVSDPRGEGKVLFH